MINYEDRRLTKDQTEKLSDIGMERAALAFIVKMKNAASEIVFKLKETDFYLPRNRNLFVLLKDMVFNDTSMDPITILSEANRVGIIESIGADKAAENLSMIFNLPLTIEQLGHCINRLKLFACKRDMYYMSLDLKDIVMNPAINSVNELITYQESKMLQIELDMEDIEIEQLAKGAEELLVRRKENPVDYIGIKSGFPLLDARLSGFRRGSLTVLAARPKRGKSAFLLAWAKHIAINLKIPVLFISTEMSTQENMDRMLGMVSGVNIRKIEKGIYADDPKNLADVETALSVINSSPFHHIYLPTFTFEKVLSVVRMFLVRHVGFKFEGDQKIPNDCVVFFDYIKITETNEFDGKEHQQLGHFTSGLKNIVAGKLNIPVVTAVQLNREGIGETEIENLEGSVSGSDRILQFCTNLLVMRNRTQKEREHEGKEDHIFGNKVLGIAATRHGGEADGSIRCFLNYPTMNLTELPYEQKTAFFNRRSIHNEN